MSDSFDPKQQSASSVIERPPLFITLRQMLYVLVWILVCLALLAGLCLLLADLVPGVWPHTPLSAVPLFLIGCAYLLFQVWRRPGWVDLAQSVIVSSAFLCWGFDQLLPPGWFALALGDFVIALYVIDLGWTMIDRLMQRTSRL